MNQRRVLVVVLALLCCIDVIHAAKMDPKKARKKRRK